MALLVGAPLALPRARCRCARASAAAASAVPQPAPASPPLVSRRLSLLLSSSALSLGVALPAAAFDIVGEGVYTRETLPKPFIKAQRAVRGLSSTSSCSCIFSAPRRFHSSCICLLTFVRFAHLFIQAYAKLVSEKAKALAVSSPVDFRLAVRLLFNDAAAGGRDGSVHFPEEMKRPENEGLGPALAAASALKAAVDAASTTEDSLSWTDAIGWVAQASSRKAFRDNLRASLGKDSEGKDRFIPPGLAADFPEPRVGGKDGDAPAAPGQIPARDADVAAWKACFAKLGLRNSDLAVLGPLLLSGSEAEAEAKLRADDDLRPTVERFASAKKQLARTSYEVQFAASGACVIAPFDARCGSCMSLLSSFQC